MKREGQSKLDYCFQGSLHNPIYLHLEIFNLWWVSRKPVILLMARTSRFTIITGFGCLGKESSYPSSISRDFRKLFSAILNISCNIIILSHNRINSCGYPSILSLSSQNNYCFHNYLQFSLPQNIQIYPKEILIVVILNNRM